MTFNDDPRMGVRDVAWFCEDADTMTLAGTHLIKGVVDYRTVDHAPVFMPLVAALGRTYIGELA